ncbi:LPS-assembly protein LptD [Parerythrobacter lacustris]|uniref:LPS-assembly protein LptD n=1 Tax=Parerythrobacter lacustris TaxID=2969984 RepID=A0ABT1XNN4_9SPHN|nr:LPS assembly protein LptD [Parerythrobacter lacustris]MCR2833260.1 LPS assembly protein LptD [Parerythrobacter lacustris]
MRRAVLVPDYSVRRRIAALGVSVLGMSALWAQPALAQVESATGDGEVIPIVTTGPVPVRQPIDTDEPVRVVTPEDGFFDQPPAPRPASADRVIDFEADQIAYNSQNDTVTASGNVILRSEDRSVRANEVVWSRQTGQIVASGGVRFVDEAGNQLFTERVELTEEFEAGSMDELLLALREGGRLAARSGERGADGTVVLMDAAYSACAVVDADGCDKDPSWRVTADRVTYDPDEKRIRFKGAFLELFGARILPLPGLAVRTDGKGESGFLVPDLRVSESNGVEVSGSYYWRVADNKDLELTGYVFSEAPPMVQAKWRHLAAEGAYQITGYVTRSARIADFTGTPTTERDLRGYIDANGKFQFTPEWSISGSLRLATDRTFLRRYDISRDDRLRSTVNAERIDEKSYLSISGWATQTLRLNQDQGQVPIAVPIIDYRRRMDDPTGLGGTLELQANTLSIVRDKGQDTQRAFASARWDLRRMTGLGQVVTLSALARGDVYHSDENALTATALYRGNPGWEARGIAVAAIDMQWPFVGEAFGGTQVLTPRVQIVASPPIRNLAVPNEDARAIDLEDSNLFALNRFPGYDRVEDGVRVVYGFDWDLQRPGWRVKTTFGQSYRLDNERGILVDGTGLSERVSDFVGRTEVRYRDFVQLTHRYRLDKDNLAIRRNEFDATIGSKSTYAEVGYLRLNRDIAAGIEDLQDREELRLSARVAFARYWSVFGSGVFNLTDAREDPLLTSDGFEPIRTRVGVAYQDDCLEMGLTWRRDYTDAGDAQRGDTFQLYFAIRNFGFR